MIDLPRPGRRGTLLVLNDAPHAKVVDAALRNAFTAGRIVTVARATRPRSSTRSPPERMLVGPDDPRFRSPPDSMLVVVEMPDAEAAIALVAREARDVSVSVWAQDDAKGERVARRLPSPTTWIGRHGDAPTPVEVRIARHVALRRLESRAAWAPEPSRLPIEARTALAELRYGRQSRRWPALRALVRTARRER